MPPQHADAWLRFDNHYLFAQLSLPNSKQRYSRLLAIATARPAPEIIGGLKYVAPALKQCSEVLHEIETEFSYGVDYSREDTFPLRTKLRNTGKGVDLTYNVRHCRRLLQWTDLSLRGVEDDLDRVAVLE
jgi:hypothetical protein